MLTEKELAVLQRRAKGDSQQEIAKALGITQAAVSKFETNAHKKILEASELFRITETLGLKIEQGQLGSRVQYKGVKR
jgi:transcriptional regulator